MPRLTMLLYPQGPSSSDTCTAFLPGIQKVQDPRDTVSPVIEMSNISALLTLPYPGFLQCWHF